MSKKIILIDDDHDIHSLVRHTLMRDFNLICFDSIGAGESELGTGAFDLIILDESLPDGSGTELCKKIKLDKGLSSTPVIMLTQNKELKDKLNAFDSGADDYIPKPFEPLELLARVNARLRVGNGSSNLLERGDLKLDLTSQSVIIEGHDEDPSLTPIEFKILYQLAVEEGGIRSRQDLLESVWGKNQNVIERTVDQHVSKLRKKLEPSTFTIKSLHKKGYLLSQN
jgi:DNA-binding response OmpR family regulator